MISMDLIHPGEPGFIERRAQRRASCQLDSTIRLRGRFGVAGRTVDLTPQGARVEEAGPFPAGSQMWVRLPGLESQSGTVIWSRLGTTGVIFDRPLHPAVYARFLPADSRITLVTEPAIPASIPAEIAALPRREQIVRGYAEPEGGPLRLTKKPQRGGLSAMIHRSVARRVEHREEERFADAVRTGPMRLEVAERAAEVRNVSSSGLKVATALESDVGEKVEVAFEGFDAMIGRVVWRRAGEMGLSLPREALALDDA